MSSSGMRTSVMPDSDWPPLAFNRASSSRVRRRCSRVLDALSASCVGGCSKRCDYPHSLLARFAMQFGSHRHEQSRHICERPVVSGASGVLPSTS